MKICVAQTRPVKGDMESNIDHHKQLIGLALSYGADTIIFPELSITAYEPELAKELATYADNNRFEDFQHMSDTEGITIGVGVPTKNNSGICISMVLFAPYQARQTYSKMHLHPDEEAFFVSGQTCSGLMPNQPNIALAICYELSVPQHAENAFQNGANVYITSVAKSVEGVNKALNRLAEIASTYSMTVFMSNCVGYCDNFECGGKTSVWNKKGLLVGQLDETREGILIFDTNTQEVIEKTI